MKSNFSFLKSHFPVLENFGELAEKYLYNDSNNEISSNSYKDSYILGDYEFTLEDLRDAYIKYYSSKFSSFSEFMEFIEYAEEYL